MNYPCWLSKKDLYIAQALVENVGFVYIGKEEDFRIGEKLTRCHNWQLASAYGEVVIEAICSGALFVKELEVLPDADFEKEIKAARKTIKKASMQWESLHAALYEQLSLNIG